MPITCNRLTGLIFNCLLLLLLPPLLLELQSERAHLRLQVRDLHRGLVSGFGISALWGTNYSN
jgi:hypothetical protein